MHNPQTMLSELHIALFLVACLASFFSLNLLNFARTVRSRPRRTTKACAEVERPKGLIFTLTAFGTMLFFLESMAYPFLVLTGLSQWGDPFLPQLHFQHGLYVQVVGILLETVGYSLFLWSVLKRGRYAVSWEMRENHKLVTSGPYRYLRHPSYLAYFLMFFGLFFILLNPIALIPLVAIPGYVCVAICEEQLLASRFGEEYTEYQKRTGRFLPKVRSKRDVR